MTNASERAVVTFGQKCSVPLSRSALLSWLRSDSAAGSATQPNEVFPDPNYSLLTAMKYIVLHCSDTWPSANFTIEKLAASHKREGFGEYPGYHFYVTRDGTLYYCRPLSVKGCHAKGYNTGSIGVCYEGGRREECRGWHRDGCTDCGKRGCQCPKGLHLMSPWEDNRTAEQQVTLYELLSTLHALYPTAHICGHRDLPGVKKACPCFDAEREYGRIVQR